MFDDLRVLLFVLVVWIEMDVIVNALPIKGAILVRRIWTVEKDVLRLISNVRDNDIIRLHVSESPGVSLGIC